MTDRAAWGTYHHIAHQLRDRLGEEQPLPSEAQLCREYNVSRTTIRRALRVLADQGTITSRPGIGWTTTPGEHTPRHREVADTIRERIAAGHYPPGTLLPSETAIAREFAVSRGTARHALAALETAGLVETAHGKGRYTIPHHR